MLAFLIRRLAIVLPTIILASMLIFRLQQLLPGDPAAANAVALWGLSTPNFWLGIMLILLFSVELGWLPASGFVSPREDLWANLATLVMPAFVLGNAIAAVLMRHTRSAMLQALGSEYV